MKYMPVMVMMVMIATAAVAETPHLNLDFEDGEPGSSPRLWYAGGEDYAAIILRKSSLSVHSGEAVLFEGSASSLGGHVQWEPVPPWKRSEPRSLDRIGGGNEADEAD